MIRARIGTKLIISYILIIMITLTFMSVAFNYISNRYFLQEARENLREEGQLIAKGLRDISLEEKNLRERLKARNTLRVAGHFLESKVIVLNNNKLIYTNIENEKRRELIALKNKRSFPGIVYEKLPIYGAEQKAIKGHVILLTRIEDIKNINGLMRKTRFFSSIIAGSIALLLGLLLGRTISKPIRQLMESMNQYSESKTLSKVNIKTGDEIQELAECFNDMTVKLQDYDDQQKRFFQNTSHELKTPLMSIQGYAEAIKDGVVEGEEMEESLDIIIQESQRLKKVVNEIIYLTKLENVDSNYRFSRKDLTDILDKSLKSVKSLALEKGIELRLEEEQKDCWGLYDEEKLNRAFINVLGNGIRYAKNLVKVEVKKINNKYEIYFIDDGIGLKAGEEIKVFERFYKGSEGGTGIGLALTKAIIEGHEGTITANNNSFNGATFKIVLPSK